MSSKLTYGFLLLAALADVTHANYACVNNAQINPDKYVDIPDVGRLKCDSKLPRTYEALLDQGYNSALQSGVKGMALCSVNVTIPGTNDTVILGDIIRIGSACCDNPSTACNANRMCADPADFNPNVNASFFGHEECCCEVASSFVNFYGGNCDAPISDDGQTVGNLVKYTSSTCCSGRASACGKPKSICANPGDFKPEAIAFSHDEGVVTCEMLQGTFGMVLNGQCDARMDPETSPTPGSNDDFNPSVGQVIKGAYQTCCSGGDTVCGKPESICLYERDFNPSGVFSVNDDGSVTTCQQIQMSYDHYGGRCNAVAPEGFTLGLYTKMAATTGCCGSKRLSACGVGLTMCADATNFRPDVVVDMGDNVSLSCATMAKYFMQHGSNCSAVPEDSENTFAEIAKMYASECCGSSTALTVCESPFPTLPRVTLPSTTAPQSTLNGTISTTTSPTSGSGSVTIEIMSVAAMAAIAAMM